MRGVEPVPHEVPGDVRAHEVDAQETEVGLELEGEEADVCDLLDVGPERGCSGREVLQVGGWRDARRSGWAVRMAFRAPRGTISGRAVPRTQ